MILGIGTDLVELDRIGRIGTDRLAQRILTARELAVLPALERRRLEFVAGRFAAKEAISKALGTGIGELCSFRDIEVLNGQKGKPRVCLSPELVRRVFGDQEVWIHLSISHSESHALAAAIVESLRSG
jgi:holo-[acyl-carrier protein] synthase